LQVFRDEFIAITPGKGKFPKSYQMGRGGGGPREQPPRNIVFGYDFAVAKYEVPQNLWEAVMGSNPSRWKGPRNSVEMLSHADARAFCRAATRFMRSANLIANDELIRLPTEAEWEYFARAGSTTRYSFGDDSAAIDAFAWHTGNAAGNDPPVGAKRPNPWGLYDIHGYLWEWCEDVAHESYAQLPTDGSPAGGVDPQSQRVLRGGSWKDTPDRLTSSYRRFAPQDTADDAIGLRCVLAKVTAASRRTTHGENHSP
jgi:formylglycine-generating enzyme required for sulfatase activity